MDQHWLESVYRRCRERLFRVAWLILRDRSLGEDAVHTAFVKLATLASEPENVDAYVMRVVRNAAIDIQRQRVQKHTDPLFDQVDSADEAAAERHAILDETLRALKENEREVVELKLRVGLTFHEISDLLQEPLSTVSSRYQRTIARIRRENEAHDERI